METDPKEETVRSNSVAIETLEALTDDRAREEGKAPEDEFEGEQAEQSEVIQTEEYDHNMEATGKMFTIHSISICQYCNTPFDSDAHLPLLFPCGHFFCKNCLESELATEDQHVICPDDGKVLSDLTQLKVLSNLSNSQIDSSVSN